MNGFKIHYVDNAAGLVALVKGVVCKVRRSVRVLDLNLRVYSEVLYRGSTGWDTEPSWDALSRSVFEGQWNCALCPSKNPHSLVGQTSNELAEAGERRANSPDVGVKLMQKIIHPIARRREKGYMSHAQHTQTFSYPG